MKYMLDTNICIFIIKKKPQTAIMKFLSCDPDEICVSSVTYAELMYGVKKSAAIERNHMALTLFLSPITIMPFNGNAAEEYGRIRAELERKGSPIGPMDTMIAAHAMAEGLTVVTNNIREFQRVQGLKIEDWTIE